MPSSGYAQFNVNVYDDFTGQTTILAGVTVSAYNFTGLADLGSIGTTDSLGNIPAGTLSVAAGTVVRFRAEDTHGRGGYAEIVTDSGIGMDIVMRPSRGMNLVVRPEALDSVLPDPTVLAAGVILGRRLASEPPSAVIEIGPFPPVGKIKLQHYYAEDQTAVIHVNPFGAHGQRLYSHMGDAPFYPFPQNRENNKATISQFGNSGDLSITLKVSGYGPYARYRWARASDDLPVTQVETLTVAITSVTTGTIVVTVTAAGMSGSPRAVNVSVTAGMTDAQVANAIRLALAADATVSAFFTISGATTAVIGTVNTAAANDGTMSFVITASHGVSAATSANTTAGVAGIVNVKDEFIDLDSAVPGAGIADKTYYFATRASDTGLLTRYLRIAHSSASLSGPFSPFSNVLTLLFSHSGSGGGTAPSDPDPPDKQPAGLIT